MKGFWLFATVHPDFVLLALLGVAAAIFAIGHTGCHATIGSTRIEFGPGVADGGAQ